MRRLVYHGAATLDSYIAHADGSIGGAFAGYLAKHGQIDELHIKLYPILLGAGLRLFGGSQQGLKLALVDCKRYQTGALLLTYRVNQ